MIISFTGTRRGMTEAQRAGVLTLLQDLKPKLARHGCCFGADRDFHVLCQCRKVGHPSTLDNQAAWAESNLDLSEAPLPPLERNHTMVDHSSALIATPGESREMLRSGTWATIRYAAKVGRPTYIVFPDGRMEVRYYT